MVPNFLDNPFRLHGPLCVQTAAPRKEGLIATDWGLFTQSYRVHLISLWSPIRWHKSTRWLCVVRTYKCVCLCVFAGPVPLDTLLHARTKYSVCVCIEMFECLHVCLHRYIFDDGIFFLASDSLLYVFTNGAGLGQPAGVAVPARSDHDSIAKATLEKKLFNNKLIL